MSMCVGADQSAEPNAGALGTCVCLSVFEPDALACLAELQVLVATLSASIVGPGDGPGLVNATRLMRCCNKDGLVLKPDRPAD